MSSLFDFTLNIYFNIRGFDIRQKFELGGFQEFYDDVLNSLDYFFTCNYQNYKPILLTKHL